MKKKKVNKTTIAEHTNIVQSMVAGIMNKQINVLLDGEIINCLLPNSLVTERNSLVVGDKVEITQIGPDGSNQYKLINILPRITELFRGDRRSSGKIMIAANIQYLLAVVTAEYLINQAGYLESAIIAARRAGICVGLFISKWDLIGENTRIALFDKLALYKNTAELLLTGSTYEIHEELINAVKGKLTAVVGDRSSGKTSLIHGIINRLQGNEYLNSKIPSTYSSYLYVGNKDTLLIDTPGFRDFSLNDITEHELNIIFPEIVKYDGCYFNNCSHVYEDGCQIIEALRNNKIKRERYDAFKKMGNLSIKPTKKIDIKIDYRHDSCQESFECKSCGTLIVPEGAGSRHRNHCPKCLSSIHVDNEPGDRASLCNGLMEPVSVWVRKGGEWAIIHRCRLCGEFSSNRIAADDNPALLMSIAVRPLAITPFPLNKLEEMFNENTNN